MEPETLEALDIIWDTIEKHDEELNNLPDQITEEDNEQLNNTTTSGHCSFRLGRCDLV